MMDTTSGSIVVALDGSPLGSPALSYAEAIARSTNRSLRLLGVVKTLSGHSPAAVSFAERREREDYERLESYLAETEASLRAYGLGVSSVLVCGDPTKAILAEVERSDVGLAALSTHGRSGFDRWAMGSVADKVMRLSLKPTLIVRRPYIPYPSRAVTIHRILIPLDGSKLAEQVIPLAGPFITAGATPIVVRVEPWLTEGSAPLGTVPEFDEMEDDAAREAERYLTAVSVRTPELNNAERLVLRGEPSDNLAGFALHEHIDLVMMSTHGAGGFRRFALGSTADSLVRAGAPMLLLRPDVPPEEEAVRSQEEHRSAGAD